MTPLRRALIAIAGILGASGVAAAAASSHAGSALLGPYALIALTHAPALLALALMPASKLFSASAIAIAAGATLFCADLASRHFLGHGLFPMSAPLGGMLLIAGWFITALAGLASARPR